MRSHIQYMERTFCNCLIFVEINVGCMKNWSRRKLFQYIHSLLHPIQSQKYSTSFHSLIFQWICSVHDKTFDAPYLTMSWSANIITVKRVLITFFFIWLNWHECPMSAERKSVVRSQFCAFQHFVITLATRTLKKFFLIHVLELLSRAPSGVV